MSTREPTRLIDSATGAEEELAAALRAWRSPLASEAQVSALRARLAPELAAPTVAGSAAAALLWVKLMLGGLVALAVGYGAYAYLAQPTHGAATRSPKPSVETTRATHALAVQAPTSSTAAATTEAPARARSAPTPQPRSAAHAKPQRAQLARPAALAPERELALLQRAQAELGREPATVLALSAEHERLYPQGIFAQEREILAIEALLELGRRAAARDRAERFVRRFSGSPHTRRVRALLERIPAPAPETIGPTTDDSAANVEP